MTPVLNSLFAGVALTGIIAAFAIADPSPDLPGPAAPGEIASTSWDEICAGNYSRTHRTDNYSRRRAIRDRDHCDPHNSEVDHRVPLSVGGADTEANLWCQPGSGVWTYRDKDKLESWVWLSLCHHRMFGVSDAQAIFLAPDWRVEYCKVFIDGRC